MHRSNVGTWKDRTSLGDLFPSQHPTKGRTRFSTSLERRAGSPGCFGHIPHAYTTTSEENPPKRSNSVSQQRSGSARSASRRSSVAPGGDTTSTATSAVKKQPDWRGTSVSPGILQREFTYTVSPGGGGMREQHRQQSAGNSSSTFVRGRSRSAQEHSQHVPAALEANVAALLRRDLARKSKEELAAEETERRIKCAVSVRFAKVPKEKQRPTAAAAAAQPLAASIVTGGKGRIRGPQSHQPMHASAREGLRVQYYDKGRKMTTADLWNEERLEVHASPSPSRGISRANSTASNLTTTISQVAESLMSESFAASRRIDDDDEAGHKLWMDLQDAEDAVKTIPSSFFNAIRGLTYQPPHRILFTLHCAVLLMEPHCQVVPLPKSAIWPAVKDTLIPGNFADRLMHLQLDDVSLERVVVLKDMIATEVHLQNRIREEKEAEAARKENERVENEEEERKKNKEAEEKKAEEEEKEEAAAKKKKEEEEKQAAEEADFFSDEEEEETKEEEKPVDLIAQGLDAMKDALEKSKLLSDEKKRAEEPVAEPEAVPAAEEEEVEEKEVEAEIETNEEDVVEQKQEEEEEDSSPVVVDQEEEFALTKADEVPEFDSVVGQQLRQQVEDQSPHAAIVVSWMLSYFGAHDHIVRDRKAAIKYQNAAANAGSGSSPTPANAATNENY